MTGKMRLLPMTEPLPYPRPKSVRANKRQAALLLRSVPRHYCHRDTVLVSGEVVDSPAEMQANVRVTVDRGKKRGLQVAAVDHPVGCAIALFDKIAEGCARKHAPALRI